MTTINHDFISSGLIFITTLGSFSSMPLSKRHLVPPHLRHRIGDRSTYKSEGYSVRRILDMIRNDKGEQKSDDKDLEG